MHNDPSAPLAPRTTAALGKRRQLTVDGYSISYLEWGSVGQPPLVLLHESKGSALAWEWLASSLSPRHHVFAPDAICRGLSDWADLGWPSEADIDPSATRIGMTIRTVEQLIDQHDLDPVVIVGTGSGGVAGALFGCTHPEHTRGMVLDDGAVLRPDFPDPPDVDIAAISYAFDGFVSYDNVEDALRAVDGNTTTANDPRTADFTWLDARLTELFVQHPDGTWTLRPDRPRTAQPASLELRPARSTPDQKGRAWGRMRMATGSEIAGLQVPTLIFHNLTESHWSPETVGEITTINQDFVRLVPVPGAKSPDSVYVYWSAPLIFLMELRLFLRELKVDR